MRNSLFALLVIAQTAGSAEISRHHQTVSGLPGWLIEDTDIYIQLNPLKREQARAFYLNRGFSAEISELIAQNCVYQVVVKNISAPDAPRIVSIDLSQWRVVDHRGEANLVSKQKWLAKWSDMGAPHSAMIAFEWATFPWQQDFKLTGDQAWGMILFGPVVGDKFDLISRWRVDDKLLTQQVKHLDCPDEK